MAKKQKDGKLSKAQIKSANLQIDRLFAKGLSFQQAGQHYEAERAYLEVLAIHPGHFPSLLRLAKIALDVGRYPLALKYAKQAVELNHADAEAHFVLGLVLRDLGLVDLAESELVISQQLEPNNSVVFNSLGVLFMQQGRTQEADNAFYQAIKLGPEKVSAYFNLVMNKKIAPDDPAVSLVESLGERVSDYEGEDRATCHFALGKIYHDCGRYDEAMKEYQLANSYMRKTFEYDVQEQVALTDEIISIFDESFASRLKNVGCDSDAPIFVVGMPRSGTTLVESLLCRHPEVASIGEASYIGNLMSASDQKIVGGETVSGLLASLAPDDCKKIGEQYINLSRQFGLKAERVVDKMPDNFLRLGFILSILPNAKIIHCVRDPMDTCLSIYQQYFTKGVRFSYDLKDIGVYFLQYQRMMEHWKKLYPNQIFDVAYHELVSDVDNESRKLIEFCGLGVDKYSPENEMSDAAIRTASVWQVRQPVYKTSVQRWRHYEKHLGPLLEVLSPVLDSSA